MRPEIPKYSDPENTKFHPVFMFALQQLLEEREIDKSYSVKSQFQSPTGPIDLVLFNEQTKKVVIPIEIKRTRQNVRGSGRRQARDYWTNLGNNVETPYYISTNLELIELFRNDLAKPKTSSQQILLNDDNNDISLEPELFWYNLKKQLSNVLDIVFGQMPYTYAVGLSQLENVLIQNVDSPDKWHKQLMPVLFEYIRAAGTNSKNLGSQTKVWKDARFYSANPSRLGQLASGIDFSPIFESPLTDANDLQAFSTAVLQESFHAGKQLGQGDDFASLVHEVVYKPGGLGVVETDTELSELLCIIAEAFLESPLENNQLILDPAAGSGSLLAPLGSSAFKGISPEQIVAVEKDSLFKEALSLRLGLAHSEQVGPLSTPHIYISPLEAMNPEAFQNVSVVLTNPPYVSGVQAVNMKPAIAQQIHEITGLPSVLNSGQISLEVLFLELVVALMPEGALFTVIFPEQHLTRKSKEVAMFRHWLLDSFGLEAIVQYPNTGLFGHVTKQTVILVGRKGSTVLPNVKIIEIQTPVKDVDLAVFAQGIAGQISAAQGFSVEEIERNILKDSTLLGWRRKFGSGVHADQFISSAMSGFKKLLECENVKIARGTLGNSGNTSLTVFTEESKKSKPFLSLIPSSWIAKTLNTTQHMPRILNQKSAPENTFVPPEMAYEVGTNENQELLNVINAYLRHGTTSGNGAQAKAIKTASQIVKDLKSDQKRVGSGWTLVQRGSRTKGEISYFTDGDVLLSTNVPMLKMNSEHETRLLACWVFSIFGQIQFELESTNQEGMRKLEMDAFKLLRVPDFQAIPEAEAQKLFELFQTEEALSFSEPKIREIDQAWANLLYKEGQQVALNTCFAALAGLVDERVAFGSR